MKISTFTALLLFASFPVSSYAQSGATFRTWGNETQTKIEQDFRVPGSNLYYEDTSHGAFAFAWPQGVELHAMIASGNIAQGAAMADEIHSRYWCFFNNRWGYNASAGGCGDRYYDDNAWIAKALMELYKANNNVNYLNRAKEVIAFSMSGENPAPAGGIKFHEGDASGTCRCATAPTMVTNLMIYQATGTAQYLTDGQRLYTWIRNNEFGYGPGYRGYENAVIAQAAMLLYRITGNTAYLDDARHVGLVMESAYISLTTRANYETGQWGGHDMTAAYTELYQLDGDINWLNIVAGYLSYLHNNLKDANGRYPEGWSSAPGTAGVPALLFQASVARAYQKMGSMPGGATKPPDPVGIFPDCNYGGWWDMGLGIGRYTLADLRFNGIEDNSMDAIRVRPGYRVTLYTDDNFTGPSVVKTADDSCLVDDAMNDRVTSLVVEAVSPRVTVFKDCNYLGRAVELPVGDYTLAQLQVRGINDNDISSLRVASPYQATAYADDNFAGTALTVTADNSCLVTNTFNDVTSSLRVRLAPATPAPGTWTLCASEFGTCAFTGTRQVRYGAAGAYAYGTFTGSVPCSNDAFGDPAPGVAKTCEYNTPSASTPTATATGTATPTATPNATPSGTNLAQGKPVSASSIEAAGYEAGLAVDGNAGTRWASAFSDPQWIMVDLGAATSITRVRLNWEAAFGKSYQIQTSADNVNWTSIYTTTTGVGGIQDLTVSGNGRYARMYGTVRATGYGYSLWEFEVYGGVAATPTATARPTATATATTRATATATSRATATATARATSTPTATARATATSTARPTATATASGGPTGYAFCSNENATCTFSGTQSIAYGANGAFNFRNAAASIACNNATFGDPIANTAKACYVSLLPPGNGWTQCATENGTCSFSGTHAVAYGAAGAFAERMATTSVACNNATFGDPISGTAKACYYK